MSTATEVRPSTNVSVGLPQVNLLPPEVRAARALRHVKQWLAIALVVVVAVLAVGYAFAVMQRSSADDQLADAQQDSTQLQNEARKYAKVQPVLKGLKTTKDSRLLAMGTEVLWKPYLDAIAAVLPADVAITTFSVIQGSATQPAPASPDGLTEQGVATIMFTTKARTLPDDAAWTDALNSIPGMYGATSSSDSLEESEDVVAYTVTSMVQVNASALANRFAEPADAATEGN